MIQPAYDPWMALMPEGMRIGAEGADLYQRNKAFQLQQAMEQRRLQLESDRNRRLDAYEQGRLDISSSRVKQRNENDQARLDKQQDTDAAQADFLKGLSPTDQAYVKAFHRAPPGYGKTGSTTRPGTTDPETKGMAANLGLLNHDEAQARADLHQAESMLAGAQKGLDDQAIVQAQTARQEAQARLATIRSNQERIKAKLWDKHVGGTAADNPYQSAAGNMNTDSSGTPFNSSVAHEDTAANRRPLLPTNAPTAPPAPSAPQFRADMAHEDTEANRRPQAAAAPRQSLEQRAYDIGVQIRRNNPNMPREQLKALIAQQLQQQQ